MRISEIKFPTLIGLLVAVGGLVSGLWLVQGQLRKSVSAAAEEVPKEVKISNITDVSFSVSWITDKSTAGFVQYGEGTANADMVVTDDRDQQKGAVQEYLTHFVTVKGLKSETTYQFKLGSGKTMYDLNGSPFKAATGRRIDTEPTADVAYGQAVNSNGEPADGALVYLLMPGGVLQSALVKASGSWVIPLSTIRSADLKSYVSYNKLDTKLDISVNGGVMVGKSTVSIETKDDNPVPEIILGRDYNYLLASSSGNASGDNSTPSSKLIMPSPTEIPDDINILTPALDEKVNSSKPEIIGVAPAGTEVTIKIHSDTQIVGKVIAGNDGRFSYSVPSDLPPGIHTLTVSAVIDGVVKTITQSFTVYAAGESSNPAYSATPSATATPASGKPTATPKPSATPIPTPTSRPTLTPTPLPTLIPTKGPTPTVTPKPTATPKPTPTVRPTPTTSIPKSGGGDQSTAFLVVGLVLMMSGWWWYRKAV